MDTRDTWRRRRRQDRRRLPDRRLGSDRRNNAGGPARWRDLAPDTVFTTQEACRYLKISRPTFLKYVAAGKIRAEKVGRGWKTLKAELDHLLQGRKPRKPS